MPPNLLPSKTALTYIHVFPLLVFTTTKDKTINARRLLMKIYDSPSSSSEAEEMPVPKKMKVESLAKTRVIDADTFLRDEEQWEVDIQSKTTKFTFNVIFPKSRPPIRTWLKEKTVKRSTPLDDSHLKELPDGRWQVRWSTNQPRLHEKYILKWDW